MHLIWSRLSCFFRSARLIRLWRICLAGLGACMAALLTLAALAHFWLLPNLNQFKPTLEAALGQSMGRTVSLGKIGGGWYRWRAACRRGSREGKTGGIKNQSLQGDGASAGGSASQCSGAWVGGCGCQQALILQSKRLQALTRQALAAIKSIVFIGPTPAHQGVASRARIPASSSTGTPSSSALASLLPASAPATT